jgi:CheY-like chemotaxis protein
MRMTPRVRSVLMARASDDLVRRAARSSGMRTMFMDGLAKVQAGVTVLEEVMRVVPPDEPDEPEEAKETAGDERTAVPAPLSREVLKARRTKILVVEDDPSMLEILRDLLVTDDYDVVTATDGREARTHIYRDTPDLILTDVHMPGMDGLELLERIRGNLSTRDIPVVFLTGMPEIEKEIHAYDLGADDYIAKPIQEKLLLSRLRGSLLRAHLLRVR